MKSIDFRCYTSETGATAETINVAAGSQLGVWANQQVYHPGVVNIYMAKVDDATSAVGSDAAWFKVDEMGLPSSDPDYWATGKSSFHRHASQLVK